MLRVATAAPRERQIDAISVVELRNRAAHSLSMGYNLWEHTRGVLVEMKDSASELYHPTSES